MRKSPARRSGIPQQMLANRASSLSLACAVHQILLESIVGEPSLHILSLNFVDAAERETVLNSFNQTALELPSPQAGATIHGLFEHWVSTTPDKPALSFQV